MNKKHILYMMIVRIFSVIMFVLSPAILSAQEREKNITLDEAISIALESSIDAMSAKNNYLISYWQFRNYKAELLPNVFLDGAIAWFKQIFIRSSARRWVLQVCSYQYYSRELGFIYQSEYTFYRRTALGAISIAKNRSIGR